MRVRLSLLAVIALVASLPAAPASAKSLGKTPGYCTVPDAPGCVTKGGGGDVVISPHIVHKGHHYSVKLMSVDGEYGGVAGNAKGPAGYLIAGGSDCHGRIVDKDGDKFTVSLGLSGSVSCMFKAAAETDGWVVVQVPFNVRYGGLGSTDGDYYAVVGKQPYIEGYVRNKKGAGVAGVDVRIHGEGETHHATTDVEGYYDQKVDKGTYEVSASKGKLHAKPSATTVHAHEDETSEASFTIDAGPFTLAGKVVRSCGGDGTGSCPMTGDGIAGVTVTAVSGDDAPLTATTDADGKYSVDAPAGTYEVTPKLDPFTFAPESKTVVLDDDEPDVDFEGCDDQATARVAAAEIRWELHTCLHDVTVTLTGSQRKVFTVSWTTKAKCQSATPGDFPKKNFDVLVDRRIDGTHSRDTSEISKSGAFFRTSIGDEHELSGRVDAGGHLRVTATFADGTCAAQLNNRAIPLVTSKGTSIMKPRGLVGGFT